MRSIIALSLLFIVLTTQAQPTLTGATNNPVAGDAFYYHYCDTTGLSEGSSGANVIWSFFALNELHRDSIAYTSCVATPYCDSFPGSNIAGHMGGDYYDYYTITSNGATDLGGEMPGYYGSYSRPYVSTQYPLTYNSARVDTSIQTYNDIPYQSVGYQYHYYIDSFVCDAYGTLMLPSGTYSTALRVHQTTYDSIVTNITSAAALRYENYTWYLYGFHEPMLAMFYSINNSGRHLNSVRYTTRNTTAVTGINETEDLLQLYPTPTRDILNICFTSHDPAATIILIADLSGRIVKTINASEIHTGANTLSCNIADMQNGVYLLRYQCAGNTTFRKVIVSK